MSPMDDQFDALRNRHRRRLLVSLLEREAVGGTEWRRSAAATVDDRDRDRAAGPGTNDGRVAELGDGSVLAVELHHVHLPRLDEQGFVDYDREADVVARGERYDELRPLLELLDANADRLPSWP